MTANDESIHYLVIDFIDEQEYRKEQNILKEAFLAGYRAGKNIK